MGCARGSRMGAWRSRATLAVAGNRTWTSVSLAHVVTVWYSVALQSRRMASGVPTANSSRSDRNLGNGWVSVAMTKHSDSIRQESD
ncbi:hypothetical protein ASPFODRAFT_48532 [Aspergillus luchuensis CBS 106.47]|uniref:Uncharacterized protein n=1 Tax=Aspergillus luchuensis (strain CBS 106.47) TaxID=1137211 RepID=A0A1M3TCT0_ASPLC|nr:hypothetical protein ASPFODRAFT_48532 [Aspergillus luchuensis CBS 106.47]